MGREKSTKLLRPFGKFDWLWRGQFEAIADDKRYVIDVDFFDITENIHLYIDGEHVAAKASPARFVDDGVEIVAAMSLYGMKYARVTTADGTRSMSPAEGTAEAWRGRLETQRPKLSRGIGTISWLIVAFAAVTQLPEIMQLLVNVLRLPFDVPTFDFEVVTNGILTVVGIIAGFERALRLKYSRWMDE